MEVRNSISGNVWSLLLFFMMMTGIGFAQDHDRNYIRPAAEPTGVFADLAAVQQELPEYFQSVKFNLPEGVLVSLAGPEGFVSNEKTNTFGMALRTVYRFRLSRIPFQVDKELYPTLEVVNRLYPPEGDENKFPIIVDITQEDIMLAAEGNLVTRVVFLENPEGALPVSTNTTNQKISLEVSKGADPVASAEQYGPVMAILRMGSRIPMGTPLEETKFYFGRPPFIIDNNLSTMEAVTK